MRSRRPVVPVVAAVTLAAVGWASFAASADAATLAATATCDSTVTSRLFRGNLVVPAGEVCILKKVTVRGDVTVRTGAELRWQSGDVLGSLRVGRRGAVAMTNVRVGRNVVAEDADRLLLTGDLVLGNVAVSPGDTGTPVSTALVLGKTRVRGALLNRSGVLDMYTSHITGRTESSSPGATRIWSSQLHGPANLSGKTSIALCANGFWSNTALSADGWIGVGPHAKNMTCAGNAFKGSLGVITASLEFSRNTVAKTAAATTPQISGTRNRFNGPVRGDFTRIAG